MSYDKLARAYVSPVLSEKEKRLMKALFCGETTEDDINLFLDGIDVDTASMDYLLMLSYLGFKIKWKGFPKEIIPRLKGLFRYYQAHNALWIKGLLNNVDILNKASIPVMLIKGVAMLHYYAKGFPRLMYDVDILVPENQFDLALDTLKGSGAKISLGCRHSAHILNGHASVDLHKWFFKNHEEENDDIWNRAIKIDFFGRTVYVPSAEDMFVHQLDTRARAIFASEAETRRMRWIFDCRHISMQDGFEPMVAIQRISNFRTHCTSYFIFKAFSDCFPEVISENFVDKCIKRPECY